MGKINGCLKAVFIAFNSLFKVFGCFLLYSLIQTSCNGYQIEMMDTQSILGAWVFTIGILGISLLGIHAAYGENKCSLTLFAVFMGFGMVTRLIFGVVVIVMKNKYCDDVHKVCGELKSPGFNILCGVFFGFAFIAMMGLIISTIMINQISRHDRGGVPAMALRAF